jgi:hypothetical protein
MTEDGIISQLQVVIANNYNTSADLHNLQSLHTKAVTKMDEPKPPHVNSTNQFAFIFGINPCYWRS